MRERELPFKPPSLTQLFEPPEDFIGTFGWVCGYSADVGFLDDAVERFAGSTRAQRAFEGRISIALMLDPSNPQILPTDVPGVLHLPIKEARPFRLLHAKVALLGFRHASVVGKWHLRLIVSTGNWTRETLEQSLDLAWSFDLSDGDLNGRDQDVLQACADLGAAWDLFTWLRSYFDTRALSAKAPGRQEPVCSWNTIEAWITAATSRAKRVRPRYFDNRSASLLAQLPRLVQSHASDSSRNYLAMGSGFYETSTEHDSMPAVPSKIVSTLQLANLLTKRPDIDVFVNPNSCQAIATSVSSLHAAGWKTRPPGVPEYYKGSRSLHAKFIFSANLREGSNGCNSAWLYLGSGNLTGPGFVNQMSTDGGNLEAGVVFAVNQLRWSSERGTEPHRVLTNLLPLQWETDFGENEKALSAGSEMPEPEVRYSAAPVAYFHWVTMGTAAWLLASDELPESVDVLDAEGKRCLRDSVERFQWFGVRPRQVLVQWRDGEQVHQIWVPVLDEFGRFAAIPLPQLEIEDAWVQLSNFPMPPNDEEICPNGDADSPGLVVEQATGQQFTPRYPVRQMMEFVENIAAKQTAVSHADWTMWCTRLEQCLSQASASKILEQFVELELNPLSPLWHPPFRPDFARSSNTPEGAHYEDALRRIECLWKVDGFSRLGSRHETDV